MDFASGGAGMLLKALRSMVPDHVWEAVESNVISFGQKAASVEMEQKAINERLTRIETTLERIENSMVSRPPLPKLTDLMEAQNAAE